MKVVHRETKKTYEKTRPELLKESLSIRVGVGVGVVEELSQMVVRLGLTVFNLTEKMNLSDEEFLDLINSQFKVVATKK